MPDADHDRIVRLAEAVADRADVDWDGESSRAVEPLRRRIHNLQVVQQIHRVHSGTPPAQADTAEMPQTPASWGPFRIVALLDAGGYGRVYRARDEGLETDVALKLLHRAPGASRDPRDERFLEEARKLARVRHPNVLTVHGVAVHDGVAGLWTELLEGVTLERRLEVEGALGANEAALVGIDLCRALSAVHGAGIVHRDVKTKNVMREKGGRIVLLDFSAGSDRHSTSSSPAGTPLYMAPELFEGRDSGVAADLYSLGVVLYRLVTKRFPVEASDLRDLERAHRERRVLPLLDARADLPAGFVRVVERALDPDPARRYASAGEMERDLAAFVGSSPAAPAPAGDRISLPRKPVLVGLAAVLVTVLGIVWMSVAPSPALRVEADWMRMREGRTESLEPGGALAEGDCLRLLLSPSRSSHVYVLNEDSTGATAVLFPLSSLDLINPLRGGRRHVLPGTVAGRDECWRLGAGGGEETLLVIASLQPLEAFEAEIAHLPRVDGSAAAPIPEGDWGRRLRGVSGLSSLEEAGPSLKDLSKVLSSEIARKAGLWTWEVRFKSGPAGAASSMPPTRALPESELERQERLLREEPENPARLTELARTLLRSGEEPEDLYDHARALELASQAFEIDPRSIDACETRAVGLERLFLRGTAVRAWESCLALGGDDAFAERAAARLARLTRPVAEEGWKSFEPRLRRALERGDTDEVAAIARRFPEPAIGLWEDELLPAWALDADREGLAGLDAVARAAREATGDPWLDDVMRPLLAADSRLAGLAEAHRASGAARKHRKTGDFTSAAREARQALDRFSGASPYSLRTEYEIAVCDYHMGRLEEAMQHLDELGRKSRDAGYRLLDGEIQWMRGLVRARQGRLGESVAPYREAATVFAAGSFPTRLGAIDNLLAESYTLLGSYRLGWAHRAAALAQLERLDDPRKQHQLLLSTAVAAWTQGLPRVAVELGRVGLASALARSDVVEIVNGSARLASFLAAAGQEDEALHVIGDARAWLAAHPSSSGPDLEAGVAAAAGVLLAEHRPAEAVAELDRAIQFFEKGRQLRLAELYPLRGRARWQIGELDAAEQDLLRGIEVFEERRDRVAEEFDPITFADVSRRVYDTMVLFQAEARRQPDAALEFAERGRAIQLRRQLDRDSTTPPAREWAALTPSGVGWIYYVLLDDRLLIWVGTEAGHDHVEVPVDARELSASVLSLVRMLEQGYGRDQTAPRLEALHELLIAPVARQLVGAGTLIVLPDKALNLAPFAALLDRATGRYLVQDHAVAVSPAATLLLTGRTDSDTRISKDPLDALIVGNPALNDRALGALGSLDGAEAEARELAALYDRSTLLTGAEATRERFLGGFGRSAVVHFAGHAVTDEAHPELSRLYLAADSASHDGGELFARDVAALDPGKTSLVVLAACNTAGGHLSTTEGPIGLARPFLGIGIPTVMATLWRIDDAASAELFTRFHQAFRKSGNALAALNAAQRAVIADGSSAASTPGVWAAVQLFVGRYEREGAST